MLPALCLRCCEQSGVRRLTDTCVHSESVPEEPPPLRATQGVHRSLNAALLLPFVEIA